MADNSSAEKAKSAGVKKYYKDTIAELKKVIWPSRQQTINNTVAVLGSVVVIGMLIWVFDLILGFGYGQIFGIK
ncbi:MAG: preprotein translocase subunit SecE [Deltaproteobacteria bacterium]